MEGEADTVIVQNPTTKIFSKMAVSPCPPMNYSP